MRYKTMGYIRANYGDRCFYNDSSFKRFNRFHCGGDTLIFNYNYGNNCCGGHGRVGFWGGFAGGLGYGLANMFMGGLNMLGGWLGLGGGNGFGGFGGGFGNWGFGGGAAGVDTGYSPRRSRRSERSERSERTERVEVDKPQGNDDKDTKTFNTLHEELNALRAKKAAGTLTAEELDTFEAKVNGTKADTDDIMVADNTKYKELLQEGIDALKAELAKKPATPATPAEGEVTIGGKNVKPEDITSLDAIQNLTQAEVDKLTPEQAEQILTKLGYIENGVGKISNNYPVLMLLAKSGVTVEVEHNSVAGDQWIKGPISGVEKAEDGKLSYTVDCSTTGAVKGKYRIAAKDTENKKFQIEVEKSEIPSTHELNEAGNEFTFKGEQQNLENETGKVAVKRK